MIARVVQFSSPQPQVIDAIFAEAAAMRSLVCSSYLLLTESIYFNQKTNMLYLMTP